MNPDLRLLSFREALRGEILRCDELWSQPQQRVKNEDIVARRASVACLVSPAVRAYITRKRKGREVSENIIKRNKKNLTKHNQT
jgi:hypothetical protein